MAVTLRSLCKKASYLYGMRIIGGSDGMTNIVQWVHTVEDVEVSGFLHGGELVFSTGIAAKGEDWLLPFIKNLIAKQVSGLVLNIGPYIKNVPQQVIDYCNAMNFPLMDIPWKTRIVDITRDFCNIIILSEKEEEDIGTTFRNLVFFPKDIDKYLPVLECHNFDINSIYCMLAVNTELKENGEYNKIKIVYERLLCSVKKHWGGFSVDSTDYYVLCNFTDHEIKTLTSSIQAQQYNNLSVKRIFAAVGFLHGKLSALSKNYQVTSRLIAAAKKKNISPVYYDTLGIKKLILAVDDAEILTSIYEENLMALENYDRENGTDYMSFLKKYLDSDGSVQKVAEETFVHRNTINYQLSKIKKIIGNDMKTFDDRFKIMIALQIKEFL